MNTIILQILEEIETIKQRYGKSVYYSCSDDEVEFFTNWVSQRLPIDENKLSDFIGFSKVANALNFNGLFVYGVSKENEFNIFDMNEVWWDVEEQKQYLFLGHDDLSWFCIDSKTGDFCLLDKPSGSVEETYETFEDMLEQMLDDIL